MSFSKAFCLPTEVSGILGDKDENSMWWSEEDNQVPTDFQELCQAFLAATGLGPCILLIDGINELSTTVGLSQQQVLALFSLYIHRPVTSIDLSPCMMHIIVGNWQINCAVYTLLVNPVLFSLEVLCS